MLAQAEENPYAALPLLKMVLTRMYVPYLRSLRQRRKLEEYNTLEDVLELLQKSKRIIVLCGAGISVSCGIPDFRSKDGIYSILANENQYQLDDPSDMYVDCTDAGSTRKCFCATPLCSSRLRMSQPTLTQALDLSLALPALAVARVCT